MKRYNDLFEKKNLLENETFNTLFKSMPDPALIWCFKNGQFVLEYFNEASEKLTGGVVKQWLGRSASEVFKGCKGIIGLMRESYDFQQSHEAEGWYKFDYSNENRYYQFKYVYLSPTYIIMYLDDITKQIEIEEDVQLYFKTVIDMLCIADLNGNFKKLSQTWGMVLGWSDEELKEKPYLDFVHKDDQQATLDTLMTLRHGGIVIGFSNRFRCKDGTYKWLEWNSTVNLERQIIISAARDVTFQKNAERALKESIKADDRANRSQSEFLANMSHEIRTPLNAVIGFSELLMEQDFDERLQEYVLSIHTSGKNLLHLVNDILDLSKLEAGMLDVHFEEVDIVHCFSDIQRILYQKIKEKDIEYMFRIAPDVSPVIKFDEIRMKQIFMNIIGNAIKFTNKGYIKVEITSEMVNRNEKEQMDLIITISDSGIGIKEEDLETIFESFKQIGNAALKTRGTGLGLTISKKMIELLNGEIFVTSSFGVGTTFTVRFKNMIAIENEVQINEEENAELNIMFNHSKVMVVDDDDVNRYLIREVLCSHKIDLFEAVDGDQALKLVDEIHPDLILMDIRLPGLNGFEIAKIIREKETTEHIPIVALTASVSYEEKSEKMSRVFDALLTKPVGITELLKILSGYLPYKSIGKSKNLEIHRTELQANVKDLEKLTHEELSEWIEYVETFVGAIKRNLIYDLSEDMEDFYKEKEVGIMNYWSSQLRKYADAFEIDQISGLLREIMKALEKGMEEF